MSVVHVVHFVENDPFEIVQGLRASVQHGAQYLGGHDETGRVGRYLYVAGDETHVVEYALELAELLIGERLDWRRVDDSNSNSSQEKRTLPVRYLVSQSIQLKLCILGLVLE